MSVDARGISLNYSACTRTVNHQVVTGGTLRPDNVSFCEIIPLCMTATIGAVNFLGYLHFTNLYVSVNYKKRKKIKFYRGNSCKRLTNLTGSSQKKCKNIVFCSF